MINRHILLLFIFICHPLSAHDTNNEPTFSTCVKNIIKKHKKHAQQDLETLQQHLQWNEYNTVLTPVITAITKVPIVGYWLSHKDVKWLANNVQEAPKLLSQLQKLLKEQPNQNKLTALLAQQGTKKEQLHQLLNKHKQWNNAVFAGTVGLCALVGGLIGLAFDDVGGLVMGSAMGAALSLPTYYNLKHKDVDWLPTNIKRNQEIIDQLIPLLNQISSKINDNQLTTQE